MGLRTRSLHAVVLLAGCCGAATFVHRVGAREAVAERARGQRFHVVGSGDTLASISKTHGVTVDDIAVANEIRPDRALSIGQKLKIPPTGPGRFHVVRPGQTVAHIARATGCTAADLARVNKLGGAARLDVGQVLKLPPPPGPGAAAAPRTERTHRVEAGESLGEISKRYGVGTKALMAANGIRSPRALRAGQEIVIPERDSSTARPSRARTRVSGRKVRGGVEHRVMDGQSWSTVASAYRVSEENLRRANATTGGRLRAGDSVRIPGASKAVAVPVGNCGYPGVPFARGGLRQTIRLLTCSGKVSPRGLAALSELSAPRGGGPVKPLHRRLVRVIQRVADEYPGQVINIVSGYRPPGGPASESRHNYGQALDFSVSGTGRKALYDFCRTLPSVGCGFYPNSSFIHLDVRERSAAWVDHSGPGESADYGPRDGAAVLQDPPPTVPD